MTQNVYRPTEINNVFAVGALILHLRSNLDTIIDNAPELADPVEPQVVRRVAPRWGAVGIIGGMGHVSTIHFYSSVVKLFQERHRAIRNADYPRVCIYGVADADNVESLDDGRLPTELESAVESLTQAGVDFISVPCNTVHNILASMEDSSSVPILDMVALTVNAVLLTRPSSVLLLATSRTIHNYLYHQPLLKLGLRVIVPRSADQAHLDAIILSINAGMNPQQLLGRLRHVIDVSPSADVTILGCTELSLFAALLKSAGYSQVDSVAALAEETYRLSVQGRHGPSADKF